MKKAAMVYAIKETTPTTAASGCDFINALSIQVSAIKIKANTTLRSGKKVAKLELKLNREVVAEPGFTLIGSPLLKF
jgi:hypothetical protein